LTGLQQLKPARSFLGYGINENSSWLHFRIARLGSSFYIFSSNNFAMAGSCVVTVELRRDGFAWQL
jgi:hypothetical protein